MFKGLRHDMVSKTDKVFAVEVDFLLNCHFMAQKMKMVITFDIPKI